MSGAITVKGIREGVLITLGMGHVPDLLAELAELVARRSTFFRGGRVALQVGGLALSYEDLAGLRAVFEENGVDVWAVISDHPETRAAAEDLELETSIGPAGPEPGPISEPAAAPDPPVSAEGMLINRTVRSGQRFRHNGYIVVLGDVNPGAELVAGGDVIVWGRLRGTVHAGAFGDLDRSVCALDLSPTQLRIGNYIARPPDDRRRSREARPERAFVSNGQIVAERWK